MLEVKDTEKFARGLCDYISEMDRKRPYKGGVIHKLYFASNERSYFVKNNLEFYKKTRRDLETFFKRFRKRDYVDHIIFIVLLTIFYLVAIEGTLLFLKYKSFLFIVVLFAIFLPVFFALTSISVNRRRQIAGETCDKDITKIVQELVNYGAEFFKEKKLDPEKFPVELKHNNYTGLSYKKNGKNYKGYLVTE